MKNIFRLVLLTLLIAQACSDGDDTSSTTVQDTTSVQAKDTTPTTAVKLAPSMQHTDSVQIIYYNYPDGDSLRYTRFFKYTNATDTGFLSLIKQSLLQTISLKNEVKDCRSIGKMYLFSHNDPVKTLYFSNRQDSCRYLYFIQDGNFVYLDLPENLEKSLIEKKRESKSP